MLDLGDERLPLPQRQHLGVAHAGDLAGVRPDQHRGRHHRCAQGARAHLIDTHDQSSTRLPQPPFSAQIGFRGGTLRILPDRGPE